MGIFADKLGDVIDSVSPPEQEPTLPATRDPMDVIKGYKARVDAMKAFAENFKVVDEETAKRATEMGAQCLEMVKSIETIKDNWKEEPENKRILDLKGRLDKIVKSFKDPLEAAKQALGSTLGVYQQRLRVEAEEARQRAEEARRAEQVRIDRERAEQQARLDAQAEAAQKAEQSRLNALAAKTGEKPQEAPPVQALQLERIELPPAFVEERTTIRTEVGSSSLTQPWTFEVNSSIPGLFDTIGFFDKINGVVCLCVPAMVLQTVIPHLQWDEKSIRKAVNAGVREIPGVKIFEKPKATFRT